MGLPEKEWFTLEEIAQRWGCSVDDLWHYAETNRLRLSVLLPREYRIDWARSVADQPGFVEWYRSERTRGPLGLLLVAEFRRNPKLVPPVYAPATGPFSEIGVFGKPFEEVEAPKPKYVEGPFIVRAERDRFEQQYRIGASAGKMPSEDEMKAAALFSRTDLMRKLAEANERFWSLYDPSDPSTAPTNEQVAAFLRERGVSQRLAEAMATILRADGLPPGPRK